MSPSPETPVDLVAGPDPVAAFREADRTGRPVLLRSSGSTSVPRRIVRSPASWTRSFGHVSDLAGIGPGSRVLVPGPLTSSMNLFARVHAAYAGAAVLDRWTPEAPPTHVVVTPAALDRLLAGDVPEGLVAVVAGDGLSPALHHRASERDVVVHHYYGAAELSFVAWGAHVEDLWPFPGVEVASRAGELWVRSPYLCDVPATAAAAAAAGSTAAVRHDEDGFATVGDRGRLEGGVLRVSGRPDTVTTSGATVVLAEVEAVLRAGARGEVLLTGLPHASLGNVLAAALTDAADLDDLVHRSRAALPPASRPRAWFHLPDRAAVPLTSAGKVDRDRLGALLGAAALPSGWRRLDPVRDAARTAS